MAKFKNVVTGNVLDVENPLTIKLMQNSDRYEAMDAPAVEARQEVQQGKGRSSARRGRLSGGVNHGVCGL